jgi:hydrogenase nickel incorporation protein HypA/HybF
MDTPIEGAKLEIEQVPINAKCAGCGHEFIVEEYMFICPECFSSNVNLIRGDELEIIDIEIE